MKTLCIAYTATVTFEVPDDFPLTTEEVQKTVEWKANDGRDGRLPFSTELMLTGASQAARWQLSEAIFQHYSRRVEKAFGHGVEWRYLEGRNRLVDRCDAKVISRGPGYALGVSVHDTPKGDSSNVNRE